MQWRLEVVDAAGVGLGAHDGTVGVVAVLAGLADGWSALVGCTGIGCASLCEGRAAVEDDVAIGNKGWDAIVSSWLACSAASSSSCASGAKALGEVVVGTAAAVVILIEGTGDDGQERARRRLRERRGP
jgi:hypothetical protein